MLRYYTSHIGVNSGKLGHFCWMNNQQQQYFKDVIFEQHYEIKQLSEHRVDTDVTVNVC